MSFPKQLTPLFTSKERRWLTSLREDLHRYPELSFKEKKTQVRLEKALRDLGIKDVKKVAKTGLVATIKGRHPRAPKIAIRGDIDALPIQETTNLSYASVNKGVMHACGHDAHASWAIGSALLLSKQPASGDVLIVLQPAEEIAQGAKEVLKSGALDHVKAIYGAHADRGFAIPKVVIHKGPISAASDIISIVLKGKSAHGARPQEGHSPIQGLAALINGFQTIVSRRIAPHDTSVVSIGRIQAGNTHNIIPETVTLLGTIRSVDEQVRESIHKELRHMLKSVSSAYRIEHKITITKGSPAIINKDPYISFADQAVQDILGKSAAINLPEPNMGAEDFAFYLKEIPGGFLRIGSRLPKEEHIPAHNSNFHVHNHAIFVGASVLAQTARIASQSL